MCTRSFQIKKLEKKLVEAKKELQHARKDNQALARYIDTKRKKEAQKKEKVQKKTEKEAGKKRK
jgi:hypothetical protein